MSGRGFADNQLVADSSDGSLPGAVAPPSGAVSRRTAQARLATLLVFATNGFCFASWMSRVPDVKELMGLTPGQLSILLLCLSVGALVGLPAAGRIVHRLGPTAAVRGGMGLMVSGMTAAGIAVAGHQPMVVVAPGLFFFGLGNGIWDVAQNFEGTVVEQSLGRSIMPWFHAGFSGGTVAGALVGAALVALGVPILAHLLVVGLSAAAILWFSAARFLPVSGLSEPSDDRDRQPAARSAWTEPRTLLIGVMVLAASITEGAANDWLAVAFVDGHHLDKALGVVALAVFLTFMTAGRILGTGLLDRYGRVAVLRVLFVVAIVGCLLVVFGNPVVAFVGAAAWGVGASLGFPVGMSAAADDPARAALRLSVVSTIGYAAFLAGPVLLGFLGDHFGILPALLAVGAASLIALIAAPASRPIAAPSRDEASAKMER